MKKSLIIVGVAFAFLSACKDKPAAEVKTEEKTAAQTTQTQPQAQTPVQTQMMSPEQQASADKALIEAYVKEKGLHAQMTPSGIYYVIEKPGTKEHPSAQNTVKCHYTGTLLNGKKFDSSLERGQPLEFPLTRVIPGWTEGIPLFGKGGKGKLIIPSGLAYGPRAMGADIPANSPLVFDVELIDFK